MSRSQEERNRVFGFPADQDPHCPRGREPQRVMGFPVDWFDEPNLDALRFLVHPAREYRRWIRRRRLGPSAVDEEHRPGSKA